MESEKVPEMMNVLWKIARVDKLEYLVWAREVKNCDWDSMTIERAAKQGNLAMVKYCVDNECPMDEWACEYAAREGHLDVLKYLHENDCPWDSRACRFAHSRNQIDCLNYLIEQQCPGWERFDSEHADYDPYYDQDSYDLESIDRDIRGCINNFCEALLK